MPLAASAAPIQESVLPIVIHLAANSIFRRTGRAFDFIPNRFDIRFLAGEQLELLRGLSDKHVYACLLYTSPSPRDATLSRMPSSA